MEMFTLDNGKMINLKGMECKFLKKRMKGMKGK
jgi:hypothetical protein